VLNVVYKMYINITVVLNCFRDIVVTVMVKLVFRYRLRVDVIQLLGHATWSIWWDSWL